MYIYTYIYKHIWIHTGHRSRKFVKVYTYIYVYMYIHTICVYVCMYTHTYIYTQGIAIEKLSEGRGDPPSIDDYVTVHYVMKTMSGMCEWVCMSMCVRVCERAGERERGRDQGWNALYWCLCNGALRYEDHEWCVWVNVYVYVCVRVSMCVCGRERDIERGGRGDSHSIDNYVTGYEVWCKWVWVCGRCNYPCCSTLVAAATARSLQQSLLQPLFIISGRGVYARRYIDFARHKKTLNSVASTLYSFIRTLLLTFYRNCLLYSQIYTLFCRGQKHTTALKIFIKRSQIHTHANTLTHTHTYAHTYTQVYEYIYRNARG